MAGLTPRVGVCSWSLRPRGPEHLADQVQGVGLRAVQLALDPIREGAWDARATRSALDRAGVDILSGMMGAHAEDYSTLDSIRITGGLRPDAHWARNREAARRTAELARSLGLSLVTLHAGFIPHDRRDPERGVLVDRLRQAAGIFASAGVRLGLETGQEDAGTLLGVLDELPGVGVNFDPANMILYGMGDPVDALRRLAPRVVQAHVKDATPARVPGTWGEEVVAGTGAVDWRGFFAAWRAAGLACDLVIEREAGEAREADVRAARALLATHGIGGAP